MEGRLDMETSNRLCGRISRSLALELRERVKPRRAARKDRSRCDGLRCLTLRHGVKHRLCLIRRTAVYATRTYGGVGGAKPRGFPLSRFPKTSMMESISRGVLDTPHWVGYDSGGWRALWPSSSHPSAA